MRTAIQPAAMSPADDDPPDREELAAQLDELEATLTELRSELDGESRGPPQPPRLGELLRFTEQYTIPTLIAMLEATIRSLELLRRTLRLADPARAVSEEGNAAHTQLDRVGTEASEQLAGTLSELRAALSATELPENEDSRRLISDARELTGEIESRLRDAEQTVRTQRESETPNSRGVMIDVSEESETADDEEKPTDSGASVDVDAELESIKRELDSLEDGTASDDADSDRTDETDEASERDSGSNESDDNDDSRSGANDGERNHE